MSDATAAITATPPVPTVEPGFTLTESAVARLRELAEEQQTPRGGLRLSIRGGGCSGLSYVMEWAPEPRPRDKIFSRDGAQVFIDSRSFLYLKGSELTFERTLMQQAFKVQNPQAKSACGCGESFTV
jgi:iron-sulfur cluster assembly protein